MCSAQCVALYNILASTLLSMRCSSLVVHIYSTCAGCVLLNYIYCVSCFTGPTAPISLSTVGCTAGWRSLSLLQPVCPNQILWVVGCSCHGDCGHWCYLIRGCMPFVLLCSAGKWLHVGYDITYLNWPQALLGKLRLDYLKYSPLSPHLIYAHLFYYTAMGLKWRGGVYYIFN